MTYRSDRALPVHLARAAWPPRRPCVLVAEDDDELRDLLQGALQRRSIEVVSVENGGDALTYLDIAFKQPETYRAPDLVVSDVRMPQCCGLDLLSYAAMWRVPTILITGFGSPELHREAEQCGAVRCVDKPFDIVWLCDLVSDSLPRN